MQLTEYLGAVLHTQGQVLLELHGLFGSRVLIEVLERAGDRPLETTSDCKTLFAHAKGNNYPYEFLEALVLSVGLPKEFEIYLWAYPHYREYIESAVPIDGKIAKPSESNLSQLIDEATQEGYKWLAHLNLPPHIDAYVQKAAKGPWLRFRTALLTVSGRRPLTAISPN